MDPTLDAVLNMKLVVSILNGDMEGNCQSLNLSGAICGEKHEVVSFCNTHTLKAVWWPKRDNEGKR
jgi:hypothetical protein